MAVLLIVEVCFYLASSEAFSFPGVHNPCRMPPRFAFRWRASAFGKHFEPDETLACLS